MGEDFGGQSAERLCTGCVGEAEIDGFSAFRGRPSHRSCLALLLNAPSILNLTKTSYLMHCRWPRRLDVDQ